MDIRKANVFSRLFMMRMIIIGIMCFGQILVSYSYPQTRITIQEKEKTVKEVLQVIEMKTNLNIFYNDKDVDTSRKITVNLIDKLVTEVLDEVFRGTSNSYSIDGNQLYIIKKTVTTPSKTTKEETDKGIKVKGTIEDEKGEVLIGVSITEKGTLNGTVSDINGNFEIIVSDEKSTLVFSYIGYNTYEHKVERSSVINIVLKEDTVDLEEVVVIGYGQQKKASVVGAITSATGKDLERTGGVTNLAQALTGNLPGVTTLQVTGQPGRADPKIFIRGQGTWNGGEPYILVDGVERRMNDLDISEIDNISVLKDASATAVYGVKGANGVILITTKRGKKGKPVFGVSANSALKIPSRLVKKLDAYDTYLVKNAAIEREMVLSEAIWGDYTPLGIVQRYRNPGNYQNLKYPEAFPNVDWQEEMIRDVAFDHRVNVNVSGGTDFVRYFSSLSYLNEGDLYKTVENDRGYAPGFGYNRFNFRSNLDFNLTPTTTLKIGLAGIYGNMKSDVSGTDTQYYFSAAYALPPNAFLMRYEDGRWGKHPNTNARLRNSIAYKANMGYDVTHSTDLTSDIALTQELDKLVKGLSVSASVSFDNHFESVSGISEANYWPTKYIYPEIEDIGPGEDPNDYIVLEPISGTNQFGWVYPPYWIRDEEALLGRLRRRLYYQAQVNYARVFGKHDVTATGVFTREQLATGSEFQRYREDWIARVTYNYDSRYFAEFNGAYNGSEKFGPKYRFDFFPSAAAGWTISNEGFMKSTSNWLDKLRLRYSYGLIGDDGGVYERWLYDSQWHYDGNMRLGSIYDQLSPYTIYREAVVGNPDIHWEKAEKNNLGVELTVLQNLFSVNYEYFTENRTDILLRGSERVVPSYFGLPAPTGNVGHVKKKGYEVEFRFIKDIGKLHLWANASLTHAVDKIISKEEPELKAPHLKEEGFQIGQNKTTIINGYINTWDEIYGTPSLSNQDNNRLPGDYSLLDFDADGEIDGVKDTAPYGYSDRPQNNYNFSFGTDYKGFSLMLQFYGVNNITRWVSFENFANSLDIAYAHTLDHWSKDNPNAGSHLPRWKTEGTGIGNYFHFDGSYIRLKTAELAYTFKGYEVRSMGLSSLRLFVNGNNLLFWSKLPDDREHGSERFGGYPNSKRINFGIDIKF